MDMMSDASLVGVVAKARVQLRKIRGYSEASMNELLRDESLVGQKLNVVQREEILEEWRGLKEHNAVLSVHAKFDVFLERMAGKEALQGLEGVPLSSLEEAVSFINGQEAPSAAALQGGVHAAYRKADKLLAEGSDPHSLTRDEIAAIYLYTADAWDGMPPNLFRPLNAALRGGERANTKMYWGYVRLLQHALFKLPKDKKKRWCADCARVHAGAILDRAMCETCTGKRPTFGMQAEGNARWCAECSKEQPGAVNLASGQPAAREGMTDAILAALAEGEYVIK